jgi:hypothetical protein
MNQCAHDLQPARRALRSHHSSNGVREHGEREPGAGSFVCDVANGGSRTTRRACRPPSFCCHIRHRGEGTLREHQRGHPRQRAVTRFRAIPSFCAAFVPAMSRPCPRFPP